MTHGPVYLRLCTNELKIVSEDWWYRFLESQSKTLAGEKIVLDMGLGVVEPLKQRSTGTNVNLESR